jgi:hypothetical protein
MGMWELVLILIIIVGRAGDFAPSGGQLVGSSLGGADAMGLHDGCKSLTGGRIMAEIFHHKSGASMGAKEGSHGKD